MLPLQRNDTLYPTPPPVAVAQERFCLCADFLQQSPVGDGLSDADTHRLRLVLSYLEQHLLLQRPEGCRG